MKKLLSLLVLFTLSVGALAQTEARFVDNEIILKFKEEFWKEDGSHFQACMHKLGVLNLENDYKGAEAFGDIKSKLMFTLTFGGTPDLDAIVQQHLETGWFQYVEKNQILEIHGWKITPNDTYYSNQWGFYNDGSFPLIPTVIDADIDMDFAWSTEKGSEDIVVAILDSGINFDHPEFAGRIWINSDDPADGTDSDGNGYVDDMFGWDFVNDDNDPTDDQGHGTSVTGVLGATGDNGLGYAGVDWHCKLMVVKTSNEGGTLDTDDLISGIYYATGNGAHVINISAGGPSPSIAMQDAVNFAWDEGVIIAASTGNDNSSVKYPAANDKVIGVGASTADDTRAQPFYGGGGSSNGSCYGAGMDIIAPGDVIYSLNYADITEYANQSSGTSLSCPMVAGVMALLKAQDPSRTPADIENILITTAQDEVGDPSEDVPGWDPYYGYGRLNANYALNAGSVGIDEDDKTVDQQMFVFPNPTAGTVHVSCSIKETLIQIYSVTGELITSIPANQGMNKIDLEGISSGTYLLNVLDANQAVTKSDRIVVQ